MRDGSATMLFLSSFGLFGGTVFSFSLSLSLFLFLFVFFSGFFSLQHSRPSAPGNGDLNASRRANANDDLNAGGLFSFFFQGLFLAHFFIERQSALASGLVLVLPTLGTTIVYRIQNFTGELEKNR